MHWAASDVSPSSHLAFHIPNTCRVLFVLCCVLGLGGLLLCCVFGFLFCKCFGIPNSPRSLDLDDRQGLIASSAMQQKKNSWKQHRRSKTKEGVFDLRHLFSDPCPNGAQLGPCETSLWPDCTLSGVESARTSAAG